MTAPRPPYGRSGKTATRGEPGTAGIAPPAYAGETYYDRPVIRASHYGWLVVTYLFIGGLSGGAQLIATVADMAGGSVFRPAVRAGRYIALAGIIASPPLLIADLRTPRRWYNMMRIFRSTSAMSIGSWTLAVFGSFSGLVALCQAADDLLGVTAARGIGRILAVPAALAGAVMSVYTGVLLSSTSVPLWKSAPRLLPALFGASAASTGTAAITLAIHARDAGTSEQGGVLDRLALLSGGAELALALAAQRRWQQDGVAGPLAEQPYATAHRAGVLGMGLAAPLALHACQAITGRRSRTASIFATLATLAGGYTLRAVMVFAGNRSARRPRDYFRSTQTDTARTATPPATQRDGRS